MRGIFLLLTLLSFVTVGVGDEDFSRYAPSEEILTYVNGYIDADSMLRYYFSEIRINVAGPGNQTLIVSGNLKKTPSDMGDIVGSVDYLADLADAVYDRYSDQFNRTGMYIFSDNWVRSFGGVVLNR